MRNNMDSFLKEPRTRAVVALPPLHRRLTTLAFDGMREHEGDFLSKEPVVAPELLRLIPKLGTGLAWPTWLFSGLFAATVVLGLTLAWVLGADHFGSFNLFFAETEVLLWAMAGSMAALFAAAVWLLRTHLRDTKKLVAERQAFIVNQLTAFDSARDPTLLLHRSGRLELVNLAAQRLFGHLRQDLHGRDLSLLVEIDAGPRSLADRLDLSKEELTAGAVRELWGCTASGHRFPIEATIRNMAGGNGERISVFVRDVSERRAAQDALRISEERFRLLVNGVNDHALFMIDPEGLVTNWNAGAERMAGYTAEEVIGRNFFHFHTKDEQAEGIPQRLLAQARETGRSESQGWRVRKDGTQFWAESIIHAVRADDGTLMGFAKITRDISERKRIEQLKDEFVSTVNHELRTPLTSIAGSLGLLAGGAGGELQPGAARLISIAHANCQRLIRLINDMLDVEKIQSGKMRFEMTRLALADVTRRCIESMRDYDGQSNVKIAFSAGENTEVRADSDRIMQVLTNLISNAMKFSPPDGHVHASVRRVDRMVRLCVRDEGPGIPDEFRARIFSKFAQADSSDTRQKGGTGLGLVITKEIVDRHGGRLWFESEVGKGTSFFVDLPAVGAADTGTRLQDRPAVLLCEDDDDIAAVLGQILSREGLAVERVSTLGEARTALMQPHGYEALVLDLVLPDGDGVSLIRELRAHGSTQELPIIVVSGQAQRGRDAIDASALNVVDWMDKPIEIARLQRAVQTALRHVSTQRPVILHVEDDHDILQVTASALERCGEIVPAESLAAARAFLARRRPDLVILDLMLGDGSGLELLPELSRDTATLVPVVVFSVQDSPELLLPQVKAVMTKSRTSLLQLAQTVQLLLDQSRPVTERKIAV
jgi:PAS domain S-box-containing protein